MDVQLSIYDNTRNNALARAAPLFGSRRARILQLLNELGPSTLFEIAACMELHDHQISGRFTELAADGLIAKTGQRRPKPETGCDADVWTLSQPAAKIDLGQALNHPDTLKIADEGLFDRQPWLSHENTGGVPYARQSSGSVPRLLYRVTLIECPECGKPLQTQHEGHSKIHRCPRCCKSFRLLLVNQPGHPESPALVLTHL
jgi:hypothetical protein